MSNYIVTNTGPNRAQRNATTFGDKTSSSHNKKGGLRLRQKAGTNLVKVIAYREGINQLLRRAGIASKL